MRIVITGSESFIGKELQRHCSARGIEVIGIDTVPSQAANHIIEDIRSPDIEQSIPDCADALVHLAAISRDRDCQADPALAFDVNVGGTLNVLKAAKARGVRQLLFASSEWVYGEVGANAVQTEEQAIDATRLQSEYALSKFVAEQLLRLGCRAADPVVTVLRFGIVYGPRPANWSAVEALCHAVRTQETVTVGSLATARRFIHVADIAEGILQVLGRTGFEVFNLSGDRLITLREIIETSAELLGRQPVVVERSPEVVSIRNPDNRKARRELGWAPAVGLADGLRSLLGEEFVVDVAR